MYQIEYRGEIFPIEGGKLDLSGKDIEHLYEIKNLERITHIKHLILNDNSLRNLDEVKDYPNLLDSLELLMMNNNKITSLEGLKHLRMENLVTLTLTQNKIKTMNPLSYVRMPKLKFLSLSTNEIEKIEGLSGFKHLNQLSLEKNFIKTLDSEEFYGLFELKHLGLQENIITSLDNFKFLQNNLPNLLRMSFYGNTMDDAKINTSLYPDFIYRQGIIYKAF